MRFTWFLTASTLLVLRNFPSNAALIPPLYEDCVVAIGEQQNQINSNKPTGTGWFTEGTGFLYGHLIHDDLNITKKLYRTYLVTAAHVIREHNNLIDLQIRVNTKDINKAPQFSLPFKFPDGDPTWTFGETDDVAVLPINYQLLVSMGLKTQFFASDMSSANIQKLGSINVSSGDGVFVLGFPMNLAGLERNYVIVRQGIIARISDLIDRQANNFLIDSLVFPGNSGGPVILKPSLESIQGTSSQMNAYIIGMVVSYTPYSDYGISLQTHRLLINTEENSGLAQVVPIDAIDTTIEKAEKRLSTKALVQPKDIKPDQQIQPQPSLKN